QADCGRNLACATPTGASSGICAPFAAAGGACLTGVSPCEVGLACVGDDTTTQTKGTCQVASMLGQACDGSRKTAPNCDARFGLSCFPAAPGTTIGTCNAVQLVGPGETCGFIGMPVT